MDSKNYLADSGARNGLFRAQPNFRASECNFRASECRVELVRAMPSAAENLEEEAVQSEAMVTGDEVLG